MKKLSASITILVIILFILSAGAAVWLYTRLPDIDSKFQCIHVKDKVSVVRDKWGVPHIEAQNSRDAYFVYGYTAAQDRLFQMELQRRFAKGETAEILGPSLIDVDKVFRTFMFRHTAETYLKNEEKIDPEALELLDAFLEGVNHCIEMQPLPLEYRVLGFKPEKFTRLDCISVLVYMGYSLSVEWGINTDSSYSAIKAENPDLNINALFPDDALVNPLTITSPHGHFSAGLPVPGIENMADGDKSCLVSEFPVFRLKEVFSMIKPAFKFFPPFMGSNSWIIGPSRSKSGKPILANDPHMGFSNPGVWYEAHIKYKDYENYGYHLPMMPFPIIAHNKYKAWALTMLTNDDTDLYYEKLNPQDNNQVMYKGEWVKLEILKENIRVKGQADVQMDIRITPHGPIITDFIKGYRGNQPVSMFWTFHHLENQMLDVFYNAGKARNIDEFEKAISALAAPGLNFSYADEKGNIAWWAAGRLPVRPEHVNSKEILDGSSGRDEILDYIPFEQNPRVINPQSGIIVTANNRPTDSPAGPVKKLEGYWSPCDRAARMAELLSEKEKWSIEDLKPIQLDTKSYTAPEIISALKDIINDDPDIAGNFTPSQKTAYEKVISWDYDSNISSIGASIFHFTTYYIIKEALEKKTGSETFEVYCHAEDKWNFLKAFIRLPLADNEFNFLFKEDSAISETEYRKNIIIKAFKNSVDKLESRFGENIDKWQWGNIHTVEYVHLFGMKKPLDLIFNTGPFPAPGEAYIINRMASDFGKYDCNVVSGPSMRILIDYGDLNRSCAVLPTGNSGNLLSGHYDDQAEMFIKGEYREIFFSREQVEKNKKHEMIFLPRE